LTGLLTEVVYLGSARRSVVRLAGGSDCFALHHANDAETASLAPGQAVSLSWEGRHATVFPNDRFASEGHVAVARGAP
uniref:TOBE domain-containing protein n=1 Tax=Acinetobacter nosocomialis TaxID=106654 RepID=UPI0013D11BB9